MTDEEIKIRFLDDAIRKEFYKDLRSIVVDNKGTLQRFYALECDLPALVGFIKAHHAMLDALKAARPQVGRSRLLAEIDAAIALAERRNA